MDRVSDERSISFWFSFLEKYNYQNPAAVQASTCFQINQVNIRNTVEESWYGEFF